MTIRHYDYSPLHHDAANLITVSCHPEDSSSEPRPFVRSHLLGNSLLVVPRGRPARSSDARL